MRRKMNWAMFRRNILLILEERVYACGRWLRFHWSVHLARAEAWDAFRRHDEIQKKLPPNETLAANEAFAYEDTYRAIETAQIERAARRYGIHIPEDLYETIKLDLDGGRKVRCLTENGLVFVIPKLQEASRVKRQEVGYWVGLAIGVIGAITGLASVLS